MNITKQTIGQFTITGDFDIAASVTSERGANDTKSVTLRFRMTDVPIADVLQSSLKDKRINWQVGARAKFETIVPKSVVVVDYRGGRAPVDPIGSVIAMAAAAGMSVEAFLQAEMAKRPKPTVEPLT